MCCEGGRETNKKKKETRKEVMKKGNEGMRGKSVNVIVKISRKKRGKKDEVERTKRRTEVQCSLFLTCPTHWIARRRREDLRSKVFKGHDLSVVLNNGLQVERSLFIAGWLSLRDVT